VTDLPSGQSNTVAQFPRASISDLAFDCAGNALVDVGCPNCGRGKGKVAPLNYAAACNAGHDPTGPCSRRCELQLEYAVALGPRGVQ